MWTDQYGSDIHKTGPLGIIGNQMVTQADHVGKIPELNSEVSGKAACMKYID